MKKPVHKAALIFFILGGIGLLGFVPWLFEALGSGRFSGFGLSQQFVLGAAVPGMFIGFGVIIDLIDQVRWNALPPEQQTARPSIASILNRLRS